MSLVGNLSWTLEVSSHCQPLPQKELSPLSVVLSYLSWNILVVITDGTKPSYLLEHFNWEKKLEYQTVDFDSTSDIDHILDNHSDPTKPSSLFVLICSSTCISKVLQRVNSHDHHYQEQGVLTYHHRWLIVTDERTDFSAVEATVANITNLSILFTEGISQEAAIYSAMWKPQGRVLELSANVAQGTVVGEIFPTSKFGLNGRLLFVSTKEWGPFVRKDEDKIGNERYTGYCIEIVKTLAQQMNFTYILKEPTDGNWGNIVNGTWNGLIKDVASKTTDLVATVISTQSEREEVMDFSSPSYIEETGVLYKYVDNPNTKAFLFIRPYKWQVWVCIVVLIPSIGFISWYFGPFIGTLLMVYRVNAGSSLSENIWRTLGTVFCQGSKVKSESHVVRTIHIFWMFTCVIYGATYSSNLVAMLAVDVERPPFNSLEELSLQKEYKFGIMGGTAFISIFQDSPGVYGAMWRSMLEWENSGTPALSPAHETQLHLVDQGRYAYLIDATAAKIHLDTSCDLRLYTDNLFPLQYAFGLQNNSAYRNEISKIILDMHVTGLMVKWKRQYWPKQTSCSTDPSISRSIGVGDLSGFFYVTLVVLMCSTFVLLIEISTCGKRKC